MPDNEHSDRTMLPTSRRRVLSAAAGLGAAGLATGTALAEEHEDDETGEPNDDQETENGNGEDDAQNEPFAAVEFSNQMSNGTDIVVDSTTLSDGGYVAIHDTTLFEGEVAGSVIGVSEYLEPGVHYSVDVSLFDVPGADFDRDQLEATGPLVAMPHQETSDNETYDFVASGGEDDGAYAQGGLPVVDAGFVVLDGEESTEEGPFATLEFENQAIDDEVTIRDVTLSEGGFVTLHDARLLQGQALESVVGTSEYLEAGRHQAVEVEVDDPEGITEVALPARPLIPMPHMDTNDNESYDFVDSEGAEDGPYTKATQAVIDAGLVTVEDAGEEMDEDDEMGEEEGEDEDMGEDEEMGEAENETEDEAAENETAE